MIALAEIGLDHATVDLIRPLPPRDSYKWIVDNIRTHDRKPFNDHDYPWVKGICQAYDMPEVRQLSLCFAARIGKTTTAMALMVSSWEYDPTNGMIAMSTEKLLKESIKKKYYKMLENTVITSSLIPKSERNRKQSEIDMAHCTIFGAWSKSPTTLSDKDPKYKHGGEVDKWAAASFKEADPLKLFFERGIEIPDGKTIIESTPTLDDESRIHKALLSGWNARFLVPCPKCKAFIELIPSKLRREKGIWLADSPGVCFDLLDGKPNPRHAALTARYRCQKCNKEWGGEERRPIIQSGKWVPEGQKIDRRGRIRGKLTGDIRNASFQLSRIYAPTFTFADIAEKIASCYLDPDEWQNTFNSWWGKPWKRRRSMLPWQEVGKRLLLDYKKHQVPASAVFVTGGIDVQLDKFVFAFGAWGRDATGWLVDWGNAYSKRELRHVLSTLYEHLDGGPRIPIALSIMDSGEGERQDEIIALCEEFNQVGGPWVWPCKGSSSALPSGRAYKKQSFQDMEDKKRRKRITKWQMEDFYHITVNTPWLQTWIHRCLMTREPGTPSSLAVPHEAVDDEDLLRQLVNEKHEEYDTDDGHGKGSWVVVDRSIPWDFRDAVRYMRTAAEVYVRGAWNRLPEFRRIVASTDVKVPSKRAERSKKRPTKQKGGFLRSGSRAKKVGKRFLRAT